MSEKKPRKPSVMFTERRRLMFLDKLAQTGRVPHAAAHAGVAAVTIQKCRQRDEEFRRLYDEALDVYAASLVQEMHRRGVDGVDEPVYYKEDKVGTVRRYSDRLLMALAKKHDPGFRDYVKVDQKTEHSGSVGLELDSLSPAQRQKLREILEEGQAEDEDRTGRASD